jgi:heme oxygenase (biliverdin-producing, ferredoxin)
MTGLAQQVRTLTREDHEAAETTPFVTDLMGGRLGVPAYARLASQHYFIYEALEAAGDALADDPVAGRFVALDLRRLPALERDLSHLLGPSWRSDIAPLPSVVRYRERLREVGAGWPAGYVAHHYTRYLGDLSGGQLVRKALQREYGLGEDATAFYAFPGLAVGAVKRRYREMLDAAPWDEDERARFVDEVSRAFRHNKAVFDELAATAPAEPSAA